MAQHHPQHQQQLVQYFYLPSQSGKPAEIIQVLNATSSFIQIPVPEEDVELQSFFQRSITDAEARQFGSTSTWRIFSCWSQLKADHQKHGVCSDTIASLLTHAVAKPLNNKHVAVA